jgi:hypothetical protein
VTVRTKEADAPNQSPPARLFLDDIEEIVSILVDANENREKSIRPDKDVKATLTLAIKDQVCDEVQELPKIATKTFDLSVSVAAQNWLPESSLTFRTYGTVLRLSGFTKVERLSIYHKLAPIFKRRNLWWATFIHSHSGWSATIFGAVSAALYILLLLWLSVLFLPITGSAIASYLSRHEVIHWSLRAATLIAVTLATALWSGRRQHSVIILRYSSEPSPLRQELLQKIPVAAVTSVLTFLLTLLGFYLKHKYWP